MRIARPIQDSRQAIETQHGRRLTSNPLVLPLHSVDLHPARSTVEAGPGVVLASLPGVNHRHVEIPKPELPRIEPAFCFERG
jgi:hypothetical protein